MSVEQFTALINILPDIEQALSEKGVSVPRPDYSGVSGQSEDGDGNQDKAGSPSNKQNIEATSEEDEGEE